MSVDIASLIIEVDATQATAAGKAFDVLVSKGERLEVMARRIRAGAEQVSAGHAGIARSSTQAAQSAGQYVTSLGAVERGTMSAAKASAELSRLRALDAAQTKTAEQAARLLAREQDRAARTAEIYARKVQAIEKSLSPANAVTVTLAQRTATLDKALAAGAITADRHAKLTGQVAAAAKAGEVQLTRFAAGGKLATHELVNLSHQINDIAVSLVSGQNPFLVLAQQGAQVGQIIGGSRAGVGGALRQLGSIALSVLGKAGPFAIGASVLTTVAFGFLTGEKEANRLANTLAITGQNATLTGQAFGEMARTVATETNSSIGQARSVLMGLAETGQFSAETMRLLASDIVKLSQFTGRSTQDITADFAKMDGKVSDFAVNFARQYKIITAAQYEHIRLLEEEGRTAEAQLALATSLHEELGRVGPENLGYLEQAWRGVANAISGAIDAVKEFGRPENRLADINAQIAQIESGRRDISREGLFGNYGQRQRLPRLQAERLGLQFEQDQAAALAASRGVQAEGVKAADRLANRWGDLADNTARARREVEAYRRDIEKLRTANPGSALLPSAAQQAQAEEAIRKRFTPSERSGRKPRDASEQAVDAAIKAEISARTALTRNVEEVARLRREEIEAERAAAVNRVERGVREGSITKAAGEIAIAKYGEAAVSKKVLVAREEEAALVQRDLTQRQAIQADLDRAAQIQAANAKNAAEQNAIETQTLEARQKLDRDILAARTKQLVVSGEINDRMAAELTIQQLAVQQAEKAAAARAAQARTLAEITRRQTSALESEIDLLESVALITESTAKRGEIDLRLLDLHQEIERLRLDEAIAAAAIGSVERQILEARKRVLADVQQNQRTAAERETFDAALRASTRAFEDLARDISRADVGGALEGLAQVIRELGGPNGLSTLFAQAAAVYSAGSSIAVSLAKLIGGNTKTASTFGGIFGGIPGAIASLFGPRPTNAGAGFDLTTGQISGNKRTDETEAAARAAAEAITRGQQMLRDAGVELGATVRGLVIGTRDLSQIYLTNGQTITSAVGDVKAAAEAGLRAVLESATYASEAQEKVAKSALAAGKSFDEVIEVLAAFEAAQGVLGSIQDEILRLRDPKAYDLQAVTRDIEEQRKAARQLASDGYLTADQLTAITEQLGVLEGLRLDEVLKRYADSADSAADVLARTQEQAVSRTDAARSALIDAYSREAAALEATIDRFGALARSMRDFQDELRTGPLAGRDPFSQYRVASSDFRAAQDALRANPADEALYGRFQSASRTFIEASRGVAGNSAFYNRDLAAVRNATEEAERLAQKQVTSTEAELAALTSAVSELVKLNEGVLSVAQAIEGLKAALEVERQLVVANDNAPQVDVTRYLAANPDLARNYLAGGSLRGAGSTLEEAALAHYRTTGQFEIAAGLRSRGYATGGSFEVSGPTSGDRVPVSFFANGREQVNISRADNMERVAKALERQNALIAQQNTLLSDIKKADTKTSDLLTRVTRDGESLLTTAA